MLMRWISPAVAVAALLFAALAWLVVDQRYWRGGDGDFTVHRSRVPARTSEPSPFDDDCRKAPIEVQKRAVRQLLGKRPDDLRHVIGTMDESALMAFHILAVGLAADDINKHADTRLMELLILNPWIVSHSMSLIAFIDTKSPAGAAMDFEMKSRLFGMVFDNSPDKAAVAWERERMLRSFGSIHGSDAANSGWLPPVDGPDLVLYIRGVAQGAQTAQDLFTTLSLAESKAGHSEAVAAGMEYILSEDASGTSRILSGLPASKTRDLAIYEMVKWLAKRGAGEECPAWIDAIGSPAVKELAKATASQQ